MRHSTVALLCLGHLATDLSQGALPALLPFLIAEYGLTYAAAGFCALLPLVPALTMASSAPVALAILVLIGCALSTTYSPLITLGQAYLPNHIGLSSGVTLGVAVSIGGVATPLLGRVADQYGLWATLAVLSFVPLVSAGLALTLPRPALHSSTRA